MINKCEICHKEDKSIFWKRCDEHYHCDRCKKHKPEVNLCFYGEGVWCPDCRKVVCEEIKSRATVDEHDCQYTSEPVCPYCGYEGHGDTWEWGASGDHQCSKCDSNFEYEVEYSPQWVTNKIEQKD